MRLHLCPECDVVAIATPEDKGAIHLDCPVCQAGSVFADARGGYECSACDQRFLIHQPHPNALYGGPAHVGGPLRWWEKPRRLSVDLLLLAVFGGLLCMLPVGYWTLLFFLSLAWEQWQKARRPRA